MFFSYFNQAGGLRGGFPLRLPFRSSRLPTNNINPNNNDISSTREYIFYIDSIEDPNINFDTTSFTYFGFCQNGDNTAADFEKGFRINTNTITDRYFSTNSLNNITIVDDDYKGYKFTNILYLYYLSYLFDQLKNTTVTFNKLLLGRLFLIGSKIYQIIKLMYHW